MCGIVGWIDFTGEGVSESALRQMADAVRHRGPDDEGYRIFDNVGLGHRRLSVIDLSPKARQPMQNVSGTVWITFNGEIYNYKALRQQLVEKGYVFQSNSDTEAILYAYENNPTDFLSTLDGMFTFALYDRSRNRLVIARDRLGKKPFYYSQTTNRFFGFASEIKALLAHPGLLQELDIRGIRAFLELGYIPAPQTPFEGIQVLPAGHWAIFDTVSGEWIQPPSSYWTVPGELSVKTNDNDVLTSFDNLLKESIRKRLQADVPVGVLLSGGLDSSAVTAMTRTCLGSEVELHSFNVGFDIPRMDERAKATTVSRQFNTLHHEVVCTDQDFMDMLPAVLQHTDSLLAEQLVPMYLVSKLAREYVTVVLSGDGADEVLGGYNSYANVLLYERVCKVPGLSRVFQFVLQQTLPCLSGWAPNLKRQLTRVEHMVSVSPEYAYLAYRYCNTLGEDLARLFKTDSPYYGALMTQPHPFTQLEYYSDGAAKTHRLNRHLYLDIKTSLPEQILMKSDLMTMAHGLELRCPFLDRDLIDFLFSLPLAFKRREGQSKWILRRYLQSVNVSSSIWNQKKLGFSAPIAYWLRERPQFFRQMQSFLQALLEDCALLGINDAYVHSLLQAHKVGIADNSQRLNSLLVLLSWFSRYGKKALLKPDSSPCAML